MTKQGVLWANSLSSVASLYSTLRSEDGLNTGGAEPDGHVIDAHAQVVFGEQHEVVWHHVTAQEAPAPTVTPWTLPPQEWGTFHSHADQELRPSGGTCSLALTISEQLEILICCDEDPGGLP